MFLQTRILECPKRAFRLRLGRICLEQILVCFTTKNLQLVYPPLWHGPFNENPYAKLRLGRPGFNSWLRGPDRFLKLRETCRKSPAWTSCQNDLMMPSYGQSEKHRFFEGELYCFPVYSFEELILVTAVPFVLACIRKPASHRPQGGARRAFFVVQLCSFAFVLGDAISRKPAPMRSYSNCRGVFCFGWNAPFPKTKAWQLTTTWS